MKVLVTGFDPFGGEEINPAYEAVKSLPGKIMDVDIIKVEVPTEFIKSGEVLKNLVDEHKPDVVLCVGQAGGRSSVTVEKVAINLMEASIVDNKGYKPQEKAVIEGGKEAYFTNLPIKNMVKKN